MENKIEFNKPKEGQVKTGEFGFYFNDRDFIKVSDIYDNEPVNLRLQQENGNINPQIDFVEEENKFTLIIKSK